MKVSIPRIRFDHYLLSEQGTFVLFNLVISLAITVTLAYMVFLSPTQVNNRMAAAITFGIFLYSAKWLRAGLRKGKSHREAPPETSSDEAMAGPPR